MLRLCVLLVILTEAIALFNSNNKNYKNELGYCEPLTVDFMASLITRKARQFLEPQLQINDKQLRFDLYTRRNPYAKQILKVDNAKSLRRSNFNLSWPVRISLHGWNGHTNTCSSAAIKDAYLENGDFNVILVDWSDYSLDVNYIQVINDVFRIARQLNDFTRFLNRETKVAYRDMYLIGHSLGCHVAGIAGKLLRPDKYGVIYALDTSGPIHSVLDKSWHLTPSDALYVESIQSDTSFFGYPRNGVGHASFFPNWGLGQTHCPNGTAMEPQFLCDHFGALYYFVESIRNRKAFGAIQCKNYNSILQEKCGCGQHSYCPAQVYMGGEPARPKRGIFYLSTRKSMPYGYGDMCRMKKTVQPTVLRIKEF